MFLCSRVRRSDFFIRKQAWVTYSPIFSRRPFSSEVSEPNKLIEENNGLRKLLDQERIKVKDLMTIIEKENAKRELAKNKFWKLVVVFFILVNILLIPLMVKAYHLLGPVPEVYHGKWTTNIGKKKETIIISRDKITLITEEEDGTKDQIDSSLIFRSDSTGHKFVIRSQRELFIGLPQKAENGDVLVVLNNQVYTKV